MNDFSTNRHSDILKFQFQAPSPCRHPDLCFLDGNLAVLAGDVYFIIHQGVLARHSLILAEAIKALVAEESRAPLIEGHVVLELEDTSKDVHHFLLAFYDGVSDLTHDLHLYGFERISALLRLSTKYGVEHIRKDILRGMSVVWPQTLAAWDAREADVTDHNGLYKPRSAYPHPIPVINLARETNALELLPSAFYDLCRLSPSEISTGYLPDGSSDRNETHALTDQDLLATLKGRESGSRFLSTFIVNELEGRYASLACMHRNEPDPFHKRICQATYEATTYEVLRDVNGEAFQRSCDPLYAIMDADVVGSAGARRDHTSGTRLSHLHRACEPCRMDFTAAVDTAREEFWHKLPVWFSVDVPDWP